MNTSPTKPWFGNVFVNPPYSDVKPWCVKAQRSVQNGDCDLVVMLLPAATDTAWFHEWVWPYADLHYIRGRVRFLGWRGTAIRAPRSPSLVAVYRKKAT